MATGQNNKLRKAAERRFAESVRHRAKLSSADLGNDGDGESARLTFDGCEFLSIGFSALRDYLNKSIDDALRSSSPEIRAIAMLDGRLSKHRLSNLDLGNEDQDVIRMYEIRCYCDGIHNEEVNPHYRDLVPPADPTSYRHIRHLRRDDPDRHSREIRDIKKHSHVKTTRTLIKKLYDGSISEEECVTEVSRALHKSLSEASDREFRRDSLLFIESRSKLLKEEQYIAGVSATLSNPSYWIRPLTDWKPPTRSAGRQFSSLLRHLYAEYFVPRFMDAAWIDNNFLQQRWFMHIGSGHNIRTAWHLPVKLNKKAAHHFLQAPDHYSIDAAFRWAQVHSLGGDRTLANALLDTRLVREFENDDFWVSVIRFLARNPLLDRVWVNPIIDYLQDQRFRERVVVTRDGRERMPPPQPNLSMRGRTATSLIAQVERWHHRLGRAPFSGKHVWTKSDINDFVLVEGETAISPRQEWRIYELLSSNELIAEGKKQQHCVASYDGSCYSGRDSIWSMELVDEKSRTKKLTIQIDNRRREIIQVRGKRNRKPTQEENRVLRRWAQAEGIVMHKSG